MNDPSNLRTEYTSRALLESEADPDPVRQFQSWFDDAVKSGVPEPNAMTLATATANGTPSARIVLLKGVDERGFIFYSNYTSRKGRELLENPRAAVVFHWVSVARQVRVEGKIVRLSREESEEYFHKRPVGSQLGAWASHQSEAIANREALDNAMHEVSKRFEGKEIPIPPSWGGYALLPDRIEFWQGRENRLHDRLVYTRAKSGGWSIARLAP